MMELVLEKNEQMLVKKLFVRTFDVFNVVISSPIIF